MEYPLFYLLWNVLSDYVYGLITSQYSPTQYKYTLTSRISRHQWPFVTLIVAIVLFAACGPIKP
jgi:hypothetical protein